MVYNVWYHKYIVTHNNECICIYNICNTVQMYVTWLCVYILILYDDMYIYVSRYWIILVYIYRYNILRHNVVYFSSDISGSSPSRLDPNMVPSSSFSVTFSRGIWICRYRGLSWWLNVTNPSEKIWKTLKLDDLFPGVKIKKWPELPTPKMWNV